MITLYDIHTHIPPKRNQANGYTIKYILNVPPSQIEHALIDNSNRLLSCGIHPWYFDEWERQLDILKGVAHNSSVVAIGECGLDKLRGLSMDIQINIFKQHVEISEQVNKPLIIHCVRAWGILLSVYKELKPKQSWIIHGFRGNYMLANQLLNLGIYLSIGRYYNEDTLISMPVESLLLETDDSDIGIEGIYTNVSNVLGISVEELATKIHANITRLFGQ